MKSDPREFVCFDRHGEPVLAEGDNDWPTRDDHPTEELKLEDSRLSDNEFSLLTRHHDGWFTVTHS
jgi:hypothetical protein